MNIVRIYYLKEGVSLHRSVCPDDAEQLVIINYCILRSELETRGEFRVGYGVARDQEVLSIRYDHGVILVIVGHPEESVIDYRYIYVFILISLNLDDSELAKRLVYKAISDELQVIDSVCLDKVVKYLKSAKRGVWSVGICDRIVNEQVLLEHSRALARSELRDDLIGSDSSDLGNEQAISDSDVVDLGSF